MPTSLDRIQVLMQPSTYAAVLTLVNVTGKTKSNMAAELMEAALTLPKYKALLAEADEAQTVKAKEDPRTESRQKTFHRQPSAAVKDESKRKTSTYMDMVEEAKAGKTASNEEVIEGFGLDKITPERLRELQQLLKMLEVMKAG